MHKICKNMQWPHVSPMHSVAFICTKYANLNICKVKYVNIKFICKICTPHFADAIPGLLPNVIHVLSKLAMTYNWIPLVASSNPNGGAFVMWPGMLFPNSRSNRAAAILCLYKKKPKCFNHVECYITSLYS